VTKKHLQSSRPKWPQNLSDSSLGLAQPFPEIHQNPFTTFQVTLQTVKISCLLQQRDEEHHFDMGVTHLFCDNVHIVMLHFSNK